MMDDPDDPGGLVTDGPSQPRITNRAQGGARSDKTRFIRPVERQRMRPWLIGHLDENDIPGLVWQDRRDKIFRISWKHAANQCFNMQKDTNLFERWAIHTGRHQDSDHKRWKANFRCALNSLPDVAELKEQGVKKGNNAFKVYRFLNEKEVKRGKETRQRRKRGSMEYDEEEDNVPIKGEVDDSYFTDQPGTSTEAEIGPSGSTIPDLTKLVSSTSALDFNIESKEGLKQITGNMDSLQEILAAATASLAAGSDALALEKISIEQLSHLGEASKVKLDIRQSDRKRRKKEVTGILYVFLCHWCEKVFPSRVDLYQHFLIVHQDKLLSGEEYKMKRETLQQEIEDLEKKVLGFTQETIQVRDSEEVIEDGQVVDLSSNNSMTSQEVYIEDQALDLSIAGAMAKHSAVQPDVALDLSLNNSNKQKASQKNAATKGVIKRRRSSAMDVDYTVKFGNYGLAGAPRTKRQLSLLLKKKEEEEEKQRKQAEAQHSMEDIAHAEILISLKSASNEDNESESIELDDKAVKEAVSDQARDVDMGEDDGTDKVTGKSNVEVPQGKDSGESNPEVQPGKESCESNPEVQPGNVSGDSNPDVQLEKDTGVFNPEVELGKETCKSNQVAQQGKDTVEKPVEETSDGGLQESEKVDCVGDKADNTETVEKEKVDSVEKASAYKCGICKEKFESVLSFNEHLNISENECAAKLMNLRNVPGSQLGLSLPQVKSDTVCSVCKVQFQSAEELNEHGKTHPNLNRCHKEFVTVNELMSHSPSETQGENGLTTDTVTTESASDTVLVDCGGDASATSSVYKITDQKNLKGEPVVSPAAGSETVTGVPMNECSSTDRNMVDDKGDASVDTGDKISAPLVNQEQDDLGSKTDSGKKAVNKPSGNDVVDGEHLLETDAEHDGQAQSKIEDKKLKTKVAVNVLKSDVIRKDMVLCGLCNLRLDFKDVQSHLESHKFTQERNVKVKEDCPCMICDQMIPIKTFYTHLRSHSVYDLSVALSTQMTAEKTGVKKGKNACNLCYSSFNSQAELMFHVKSHLGPRNAAEPKKVAAQKRKLPASEKKSKKLKTNTQSRKSAKKKPAKGSSTTVDKALEKKWITDDESIDLFKLKQTTVVHTEGGKSESSPAITAALNRRPKCETSIMALFSGRNKKVSSALENEDKLGEEDGKASVMEDPANIRKTDSVDSDVSNNESEVSQTGEEKKVEDQNFLAASRRLQEFVTLKKSEQSINMSEPSVDTDQLKPTVTVESEDNNSSTSKSKKSMQQKILLVRHGDVKVATPFFSPVSSVAVESSQSNPVALHKPVTAQTKRISNVPVLSPTQVTYIKGKTKKIAHISPTVVTTGGTSVTATITTPTQATAVPVSLVRNLFNLPVGKKTPLSAVTLKKKMSSSSSVSQICTVGPPTVSPVPVTVTRIVGSSSLQVSERVVSQCVSSSKETASVPVSSVQKTASPPTLVQALPLQQQLPGAMNVNIVMAKGQSSNKSVRQPGITTKGVKSPVYQLAFVPMGDKSKEPVPIGINSVRYSDAKPLTSPVSQNNVFTCNNCKQSLSSLEQMTSHVCKTMCTTSLASQQLVSVTTMTSSTQSNILSSLKTSGIMSVSTSTPHTKIVSTPTILKSSLSALKMQPLVGTIPSSVSGSPISGIQSSPVGMDKAKFVLSRSAILAKSLPVPLNSISTTQTGSVVSSLALSSAESSTIGSNVLRVSTGSTAGWKEAIALYPCSICRQIYMNQDSFVKHMQEHVSTSMVDTTEDTCMDTESSKTISPDQNIETTVQPQLSNHDSAKINITGATTTKCSSKPTMTIESLFASDVQSSVFSEEGLKSSEQKSDPTNPGTDSAANKSGMNINTMTCKRCLLGFGNDKALAEHFRGVHPNTSSFRCYSDSCYKFFCKEKDVDFHYSMEHIFKCTACHLRFKSQAEFFTHVKKHSEEMDTSHLKIVCTVCNQMFNNRSEMNAHLAVSVSCSDDCQDKPVANMVCNGCNGTFSSFELFSEHFRSHYVQLAYRCCVCLKEYSAAITTDLQQLEDQVLNHMNEHVTQVSDKLYFCHVCYFLFPNREVQSIHMASDSHKQQIAKQLGGKQQTAIKLGGKPLTANKLAGKQQTSNSSAVKRLGVPFKRTSVKIPPSSPAKKFKEKNTDEDGYTIEQALTCGACNVCFSSLFQLKAHKAIWHRSNKKGQPVPPSRNLHPTGRWDKLLVCEFCGVRFFSVNLFNMHREKHAAKMSLFMCKEPGCMQIFASKPEVTSHVCLGKAKSQLENPSSMLTESCDALTMFTPLELEQYIIQHEIKNSEFHLEKATLMIEQLQTDLGDFFECMFCKKSFASSDFLRQHMIKKHNKKLFQCVDCEQYFHQNISLMIHRRDCAVRAFSDQDFHTKKKHLGCNVCYRSFIQLVSLACYIADMNTDKTEEIISSADLKLTLDRIKREQENILTESWLPKLSGKFVCMECRNEYCDADDLYMCMRSRINHKLRKVLGVEEYGTSSDTVVEFSNDSMFYCNKCETIVCYKPGEMCLASLQHPCIHSETLL